MGDKSNIEWTDATWNPVTGCTKVSPGCDNCYAEKMSRRLKAMGQEGYKNGFKPTTHPDRLDQPSRWTRPRKVFVCSMGDLFHRAIPTSFIEDVYVEMENNPRHIFQVLTKRPERMRDFLKGRQGYPQDYGHIYHGATVENNEVAMARVPVLLDCPSQVRFLSCEPLLEELDIGFGGVMPGRWQWLDSDSLNWVIIGGESGPGARMMYPHWALDIIEQCQMAGVKVFMKQFGSGWAKSNGEKGKGKDMETWPEWARVQEVPWE